MSAPSHFLLLGAAHRSPSRAAPPPPPPPLLLLLQAPTPYLLLLDDDNVPGARFLEACLHTISTPEYRGLLGINGHVCPAPLTRPAAHGHTFVTGEVPMYEDPRARHG